MVRWAGPGEIECDSGNKEAGVDAPGCREHRGSSSVKGFFPRFSVFICHKGRGWSQRVVLSGRAPSPGGRGGRRHCCYDGETSSSSHWDLTSSSCLATRPSPLDDDFLSSDGSLSCCSVLLIAVLSVPKMPLRRVLRQLPHLDSGQASWSGAARGKGLHCSAVPVGRFPVGLGRQAAPWQRQSVRLIGFAGNSPHPDLDPRVGVTCCAATAVANGNSSNREHAVPEVCLGWRCRSETIQPIFAFLGGVAGAKFRRSTWTGGEADCMRGKYRVPCRVQIR